MNTNKTFSLIISMNNDNFNFTNKELPTSSWKEKKKSPSQVRREERRRREREAKRCEASVYVAETSDSYSCKKCEMSFDTEKGLNIHIGRIHKSENVLESTPEKERIEEQEELSLSLSPIKEVREEPPADLKAEPQSVCTKCGDLWGPVKKVIYESANYVDRVRWNSLCSTCWTSSTPYLRDIRFLLKILICLRGEES